MAAAVLAEQQETAAPEAAEVSKVEAVVVKDGPVAANLLRKLDQVADKENNALVNRASPTQCRAGHALVRSVSQLGTCDACSRVVHAGQLVFECKPCNYYVCQRCRPIEHCSKGHPLQTSSLTSSGKCDGCARNLKRGEVVSEASGEYLCGTCRPLSHCPSGHKLQKWASQAAGTCDQCFKAVPKGGMVMDCRRCNWFVCQACHPTDKDTSKFRCPEVPQSLPRCGAGHAMQPRPARAGSCDGCGKQVLGKELVMSCEACNHYLCAICCPVRHCPEGHELQSEMALPGVCDGCTKKVQNNEMVMQCRKCNWYLCSSCHVARQ